MVALATAASRFCTLMAAAAGAIGTTAIELSVEGEGAAATLPPPSSSFVGSATAAAGTPLDSIASAGPEDDEVTAAAATPAIPGTMLTPEVAAVDMSAAVPAASISAVDATIPTFSLLSAPVEVDAVRCPDDDDPCWPAAVAATFFFRLLLLLARFDP